MKEVWRVATALMLGAFAGALNLAFLLQIMANLDAGQPWLTDISLRRMFWMSLAFCLFTVPIAFSFGAPLYLLFRRLHWLRVWICAVTGALIAIAYPYSLHLFGFGVSLPWQAVLWFVLSGATAGALAGFLLRHKEEVSTSISRI
jgi:hypothetical protein